MGFVWAIVVGLVVGIIARAVLPGRQNIPVWLTIVLGLVGALIGTAIAKAVGVHNTNGFDWIQFILQVAAAAVLIALVSPIYGRSRTTHRL
ncbi:MAG: hypothetical protein QOH99_99 [Frankiaceae bacterium]|jgi:uncharacterized membrane protein YeaQ/YmgE (transglycosylase-associated protein family)|nr:hypothetical protein [Frankiaceae bacterium]